MTGGGNWTYLVTGPVPVLIDAGVGHAKHLDAIAAHLPDGPDAVVVTHAHSDHAAGAEALAARFPRARFFKWPWPARDARYPVQWTALADDELLHAGHDVLRVVHTPGHAPDHICLWHEASRTLFGGDLLVQGTTVVIPATVQGNLVDYLSSLRRVQALGAERVLPAHGPEIADPDALIRVYIDHRYERERQVLDALDDGCSTVAAIVARIYVGLRPQLVAMAQESVLAHLEKLLHEGRVERDGDHWTAL